MTKFDYRQSKMKILLLQPIVLLYKENHVGIIENKEKIRQEDKMWKKNERARINELAKKLGKPPPKRLRKRFLCILCEPRKEFESPDTYDCHLIGKSNF